MMMATHEHFSKEYGEPVWEIARLFPVQGEWTAEEYLALDTNHFVEFSDGYLEFLPMPTVAHQLILLFLCRTLWDFVTVRRLGEVILSPLPVELWPEKFREPDVMFVATAKTPPSTATHLYCVDLVMEVISPENPTHDYQTKRTEYAQAGIPEYWIIDPQQNLVTVFVLRGKDYQVQQVCTPGMQVASVLLAGFELSVADIFAAT
jgi:Uma2 family endonuclease